MTPLAWCQNWTGTLGGAPEYRADPVAAVYGWFARMSQWPIAGVHQLQSHDGSPEYKAETDNVPDPVKIALCECMRLRRSMGLRNLLHTGGVTRTGTFAFPDTLAGHRFLRTHYSHLIRNGLDILIVDKATRFPEMLDFADTSAGYGLDVWEEPFPTFGSGPTLTIDVRRARRLPHVCSLQDYRDYYAKCGLRCPDGATMHVVVNPWDWMRHESPWDYLHTEDQIISEMAGVRAQGFTVSGGVGLPPACVEWILNVTA